MALQINVQIHQVSLEKIKTLNFSPQLIFHDWRLIIAQLLSLHVVAEYYMATVGDS